MLRLGRVVELRPGQEEEKARPLHLGDASNEDDNENGKLGHNQGRMEQTPGPQLCNHCCCRRRSYPSSRSHCQICHLSQRAQLPPSGSPTLATSTPQLVLANTFVTQHKCWNVRKHSSKQVAAREREGAMGDSLVWCTLFRREGRSGPGLESGRREGAFISNMTSAGLAPVSVALAH